MKSRFLIQFLYLLLVAACRTSPTTEPEYNALLQSDEPLSNEELERALTAIQSDETLPEIRWALYKRLFTEDFSSFKGKFPSSNYGRTVSLGDGTECIVGTPPRFDDVSFRYNTSWQLTWLLAIFHEPKEFDEVKYYTFMLDFMEGPTPSKRKVNGLYNIQRVMKQSRYFGNLNEIGMEKIANRLYALADDEKTPDIVRNELNIWLDQMNQGPEEKVNEESSKSSTLRFFEFQDDGSS